MGKAHFSFDKLLKNFRKQQPHIENILHSNLTVLLLYAIFFMSVAFIIIFRKPDAIINPQFWAEDGSNWFADSYNATTPLYPFLLPHTGYLQTYSRLIAAVSQLFPLSLAPLLFNIGAIIAQSLPPAIILIRYKKYVPSLWRRLALVGMYLFLPYTSEIYINLTSAQWFLAFAAILIALAPPSKTIPGYIFDLFIIITSGLSGPFSILLVHISSWRFLRERTTWTKTIMICVILSALIQCVMLLTTHMEGRSVNLIGNNFALLFEIVYRQIVWGSITGENGINWIIKRIPSFYPQFFTVTGLMALSIIGYAIFKGSWVIKALIMYSIIILTVSLLAPTTGMQSNIPTWTILLTSNGVRYWFIPMLSFLAIVVWGLGRKIMS